MAKKQTKKEEKIAKAIKRFSKHEDNIKILKEVVDIYNRNWEYLQEKHQEYTTDEVEAYDCGGDIPSEDEALYAFKSLLKIK